LPIAHASWVLGKALELKKKVFAISCGLARVGVGVGVGTTPRAI
jgi:hypothetical protein